MDLVKFLAFTEENNINLAYFGLLTTVPEQWKNAVEGTELVEGEMRTREWDAVPDANDMATYTSRSGLRLMSPYQLAKTLDSQAILGAQYFDGGKGVERKPPRDQVLVYGRQTGFEAYATALLLQHSEWPCPAEGTRRARIDVVTPEPEPVTRMCKPWVKNGNTLVRVYHTLDACMENSPALRPQCERPGYDGIIKLEDLSKDVELGLRR